ncbi:unnamed protein product [Eruca vesicaria subsp. sativa]|uniref:Uncharacterized protein n=1 Tax=Eruca vesicaria subsp. sativa TaxID=29727 RepID=A0ABC8IZM1_ERUVS|nr:unnamed protein product [Eruca vesicaria subsp. sativa]
MASIMMFFRALMSCHLTPKEEPETAVELYRNVAGDENTTKRSILVVDTSHGGNNHEFTIETTCGINDTDERFYWIIVKNHLLL